MHEAMNSLTDTLTPPPAMLLGPRRLVAWIILAVCIVVMRLSIRLLPRTSPFRIFVEGSTGMLLDAVSPSRMLSAPAPTTPRGS
jgi:hypothetical protein